MLQKKLPLHEWHEAHDAKMINVGGTMVPNFYSKIEKEYIALRQNAALVDNCHRALFRVEIDEETVPFLNKVLTLDFDHFEENSSEMAFMLNDRGGIIDRFTIYRGEDYFLLMGSSIGRGESFAWLKECAEKDAEQPVWLADASDAQCWVSVLGPSAKMLVDRAAGSAGVSLEPGQGGKFSFRDIRCLAIRRPTGRLEGYDIIVGKMYIRDLWEHLIDMLRMTGGVLAGFGALEVYRIEAGEARLGTEIDETTMPQEINEDYLVDYGKEAFHGRRALMHAASADFGRSLACVKLARPAKLTVKADIVQDNLPIGRVSSVATSPLIRSVIALGFVNSMKAYPGTRVTVVSQATGPCQAEVVIPPGSDSTQRVGKGK